MFTWYINHVIIFLLSHSTIPSLTILLISFLSLSFLLALLLLLSSFPSSSSPFLLKTNQTNNKAIAASVQAFRLIPWLAQWKGLTRSWFKGLNIVKISSLLFPSSSLLPLCLYSLLSHLFSCTSWALTISGSGQTVQCQCWYCITLQDRYCDVNTLNRMYSGCRTSPQRD